MRARTTRMMEMIIMEKTEITNMNTGRVVSPFEVSTPHWRSQSFFDPATTRCAATAKLPPGGAQTVAVAAALLAGGVPEKSFNRAP
jgi:hypothetical protein